MINHWWVTRPKRRLNSIPEVLATVADVSLNQEWQGQIATHLNMETALEQAGLKRVGDRRDQRGGGARTYIAWLKSLGLLFTQEATGLMKLTLAGEAILNGEAPVAILKGQVLKYQFPSNFSISRNVEVSSRFKIHPYWFLLKLLRDGRLNYYLTQEEIGKIVIVEAENETDNCYNSVVNKILLFRSYGDSCLDSDFEEKYRSDRSENAGGNIISNLLDVANTMINWLDYTQLIYRDSGKIAILPEKTGEVDLIITNHLPFIDRPASEEYYQRKYGIDPNHNKDTRNLMASRSITPAFIADRQIRNAFIAYSIREPIFTITPEIISSISQTSGFTERVVEDTLLRHFPNGAIGSFMTNYFEMAFKGREDATDFEKATKEIFEKVFGYEARHIGPIGLTPDVQVISNPSGYQGIIDNKAYSVYSINNDHHNRMVENYIRNLHNYSHCDLPLAFFSYIAGGFSNNIDNQLEKIRVATGIKGSAVTVSNIIKMVEHQQQEPYTHSRLKDIFSVGRQVAISDLQ